MCVYINPIYVRNMTQGNSRMVKCHMHTHLLSPCTTDSIRTRMRSRRSWKKKRNPNETEKNAFQPQLTAMTFVSRFTHTPMHMAMKTAQCVLALLYLSVLPVQSFRSVPVPPRIGTPRTRALLKSTSRDSNMESNTEPILLPPADYSKPGRVVHLVGWASRSVPTRVCPLARIGTCVQGLHLPFKSANVPLVFCSIAEKGESFVCSPSCARARVYVEPGRL